LSSPPSLLEQVRSGENRQLQALAASGLLPLPPEQLIPLQVTLARGVDEEIAGQARESLKGLEPRVLAGFLQGEADAEALSFFAGESTHPVVLEAILRRRDVPRPLLVELARRLPADLQEVLLLRQDAIVEEPPILDALEQNLELSTYSRRRIAEYRQHLLPRERAAEPVSPELEEMDDAALEEAIAAVREIAAEGEVEAEKTGLPEGQIRMLPVPARLKLSRGAPRMLRMVLVRDSNAQVAVSVVMNNTLSEQEVEHVASSRSVVDDVLIAVSKRREWVSKYHVARALAFNPRTPLPTAIRLVPRLSVRDLREMSKDRNVPEAVRSTAFRLYTIKSK
jgi:hypothetical protein